MNSQSSLSGAACDRLAPFLPLLHAGELNADEAAAVQAHLRTCRRCQQRLREYAIVEAALREHIASFSSSVPGLTAEAVSEMVAQEHAGASYPPPAPASPRPRRIRRFVAWLAPVAAVLVMILLTVTIFSLQHPSTGVSSLAPAALYVRAGTSVAALGLSDGKLLWRSEQSGFIAGPVSDEGRVYGIVSGNGGVTLLALSASDGSLLWQSQKMPALNPTLVAADGVVYFSNETYHNGQSQTLAAPMVLAFRGSDGHLLWQYHLQAAHDQIMSEVVAAGGQVYFEEGVGLTALRARDGHLLWRLATNFHGLSYRVQIATDGNIIYLYMEEPATGGPDPVTSSTGIDAHLTAVQIGSGGALDRELWNVDFGGTLSNVAAVPVVADGMIYLGGILGGINSDSGEAALLYALRASDGHQVGQWKYPIANDPSIHALSGPIFAENTLYFSEPDGVLLATSTDNGRPLWQRQLTPSDTPAILIMMNGTLFLQENTTVWAVQALDGRILWRQSVGSGG
jgi:outer membrane protein assembly factor BamB